ncbi:EamA family transporter RarD [Bacillota bacterium LX-D]|nr:EamA family transporter RarD [Bacillota bacterium LX-D]
MNRSISLCKGVSGIYYSVGAYMLWGFLPLFWKALQGVPPQEILAHRIFWSFLFVFIILIFSSKWKQLKPIMTVRGNLIRLMLSSFLISANWFIYIWAVNANKIVETSLGYYINPLFTVFLGITVLREKIDLGQIVALAIACIGVIIISLEYGKIPWVALLLALTFGLYGLIKKLVNVDSTIGLCIETLFVFPVAAIYIIFSQLSSTGSFGVSLQVTIFLISSGVVTAIPLLWFAAGARRISLTTLGFIQYLSPSISLLLGVFVYHEPFTKLHLLSFSLIWCAIFIYSFTRTNGYLIQTDR